MKRTEINTPVLSIIIPTRNRIQYITSTISSILNTTNEDFELVIHDTSDTRELEKYVYENYNDIKLRYFYTAPPLTFSETFNKSVLLSKGEYVCIIGDDDGVNPEIIQAARWAKEQKIDAITPLINISYFWPDFRFKYYRKSNAGCLKIGKFSAKVFSPNIEEEILNCTKGAFQDFSLLPKIYNGIVRRSCLDKLYHEAGSFFFGASPDVSGALAVASYINHLCIIDYPLVIAGNSALSGSGRSAMKTHIGRLDEEPQTKPFFNTWPNNVPAFYSVQTVWAQAAIEGLKASSRTDLLKQYNSTLLQALCLVYNPKFINIILKNFIHVAKTNNKNIYIEILLFVKYLSEQYMKRAKSHLYRLTKRKYFAFDYESYNLQNIEQAVNELSSYLACKGIDFSQIAAKYSGSINNKYNK